MNASELLTSYRKTGSEAAFTDLLRRYTNLVYSVARRRLSDQSLAEEVTQTVFTRLAKSPPTIKSDGELAAWLHRTTIHVAIDVWRSETRRRTREQQVAFMQTLPAEDAQRWEELTPHLDEALNQLADDDRQAVLLRFFERKPMRDIGGILGVSEDAAKMRVTRAVERLRTQLTQRGVTCTVIVLATLLTQRAVEAAPVQLLTRLTAMKLAVPAVIGAGGVSTLIIQAMRSKVVMGTTAALAVVFAALIFSRRPETHGDEANSVTLQTDPLPQSDGSQPDRPFFMGVAASGSSMSAVHEKARFILRVVDKETGAGLAGARVRAAYFYAGGVGERHELQTDNDGNAAIPHANVPGKNASLNVFVGIEGYVPKAISFGRPNDDLKNYLLELDPARSVGGTVVDESGLPVAGVTMQALRSHSENRNYGTPNTDFQTTKVTTDANGRWSFRHVPREYATLDFYLTCTNYAVTRVPIPVGQPESLNATVVIKRGFVITGRVTDSENNPVVHATVKEHHNYGYRKLSTETDAGGVFALVGVSDQMMPQMDLVVETKGMAPLLQSIHLLARTNSADFVLTKGKIFRGRVVDEGGNPIPDAVVRTDWCDQIPTRFEWLTHTEADGWFEWDSAPAELTCFWFEADGYEVIRDRPMLPDGTYHEIKLTRKSTATEHR